MPNAKPIILATAEVREMLDRGQAEIRRPVRPGPTALQPQWRAGSRYWVREPFATGREGQAIRIRYGADRPSEEQPDAVVPLSPGLARFASHSYRTWPARYMPRPFSRLAVELLAVRTDTAVDRREVVLLVNTTAAT